MSSEHDARAIAARLLGEPLCPTCKEPIFDVPGYIPHWQFCGLCREWIPASHLATQDVRARTARNVHVAAHFFDEPLP